MKALVEARQALIGGNELRALDKLVEGWRASKSPHIATLAEKLSKRLEPHLAPIGGKLESFQPRWLAIAKRKRAVDLPRLLGSVLHATDRFGVAVVDALVARGKALAEWPADPRASAIIVEHLVRGGYESTSKSTYPFWTAMFEMLATTADPRVVDRLAKIRFAKVFKTFSDGARRIAWFQDQLDTTLEKLRTSDTAPLTRAVSERVTKLAELIAARGPLHPSELAQLTSDPEVAATAPKQPAPKPKLEHATARKHAEAAARAIGSGDDTGALRSLLEAWRATRASRIAELVERVSRRCESRLPRVGLDTRAETHKAWLAIAREQRPEDLPRLLAALCDYRRSLDRRARARDRARELAVGSTNRTRCDPAHRAADVLRELDAAVLVGADHACRRSSGSTCGRSARRAREALRRRAARLVSRSVGDDHVVSEPAPQCRDAAAYAHPRAARARCRHAEGMREDRRRARHRGRITRSDLRRPARRQRARRVRGSVAAAWRSAR
jgi:hypothetical protein